MTKNSRTKKVWMAGTALATLIAGVAGVTKAQASTSVTELTFDFPVAVAGPLAQDVTNLVNRFNAGHPSIHVTPVFSGDYTTIMTKVKTGESSGTLPDVAVLLSTDLFTLKDMNAIVPVDNFAKDSKGKAYLKSFYPAFMANSQNSGKTWGIPFQRSTLVLYYNKDEFKKAGISGAPTSWKQLLADAQKLTNSNQWGLEIPTSGLTYWEFQPFAIENGQNVVGPAANKVYFNSPKVVQALQFFGDLSTKYKVEPSGLIGWTTAPADFTTGKAAMIYHSSGSLTSILNQAKFPVGVAMLPGNKQYGTPTGGGNMYIMNTKNTAKEKAAYQFVQWMTSPANQAEWSIETGYVATSPAAYKLGAMRSYLLKTPQADVAHQQLKYAQKELTTHDGNEIQQILSTACQQVLTGAATPQQALNDAQKQANSILSQYKN